MANFKQKLFNGILWRLLLVISAFVFNITLVNHFGAVNSGVFFFQLNNLSFAVLFLGFGLESGISYYGTRKEITQAGLFMFGLIWSLGASLFFVALFYGTGLFNGYPGAMRTPFVPAYIFGSLLTTLLGSLFYSNHDSKTPNLLLSGANILLTLILLKKTWAGVPLDTRVFTNCYFLVYAVTGVLMILILNKRKTSASHLGSQKERIPGLLKYSFFSFMLAALYTLLKRSDYWLVERFCSPADMGNYFQSTKIIQLVLLLPSLASFSLYPLLVESIHLQKDTETKVIRLSSLYMVISLIISAPLLLSGYWIFPFLYGGSFDKLYHTVVLLTPGLVMFSGTYPLTVYFSGINKNGINIRGLSFSIAIMVGADLFLLPHYSIYGAAAGNALANTFYFGYLLFEFKRINNLNLRAIAHHIRLKEEFFSLLNSAGKWIQ